MGGCPLSPPSRRRPPPRRFHPYTSPLPAPNLPHRRLPMPAAPDSPRFANAVAEVWADPEGFAYMRWFPGPRRLADYQEAMNALLRVIRALGTGKALVDHLRINPIRPRRAALGGHPLAAPRRHAGQLPLRRPHQPPRNYGLAEPPRPAAARLAPRPHFPPLQHRGRSPHLAAQPGSGEVAAVKAPPRAVVDAPSSYVMVSGITDAPAKLARHPET